MEITNSKALVDLLRPTNLAATTPLWLQVKSALSHLILQAELGEHAQLPSEAELCQRLNVSRTVVREALSQMLNERTI